jgi:hypothetical protein
VNKQENLLQRNIQAPSDLGNLICPHRVFCQNNCYVFVKTSSIPTTSRSLDTVTVLFHHSQNGDTAPKHQALCSFMAYLVCLSAMQLNGKQQQLFINPLAPEFSFKF